MKHKITFNFHGAAIVTVSMFVIPYIGMFMANRTELYPPLYEVVLFVLKVSAVIFGIVFAWITVMGRGFHLLAINFLFFLVVAAAIQYYFLSESIYLLDGESINPYNSVQIAGDFFVYALVAVAIYTFRHRVYGSFRKYGAYVCVFQIVNVGVVIEGGRSVPNPDPVSNVDVSGFAEFSRNENVFHVVLDGFQSGIFQDIVERDQEIAAGLEGFLYFPDTLTASEVTQLSFAAFLTGREYRNKEPMKTYLFNSRLLRMGTSEPLGNVSNILEVASSRGFEVEVATPFVLIDNQEFYSRFLFIHRPYSSESNLVEVVDYQTSFVADLIFFRSAPKALKKYVYNEGRWRMSSLYSPKLGLNFNHHAGMQFLKDVTNAFAIANDSNVYKLIHLVTPHSPFVTDAYCRFAGRELEREYVNIYNQARCALVQLIELLDEFKNSGVYDSATVLVHGDHGIRLPFGDFVGKRNRGGDDIPRAIGNTNPLLLIKPPGRGGQLVTVGAEVSLTDIPKTISELLQMDGEFQGVDILNEKVSKRIRRFYYTRESRIVAAQNDRFSQWNEFEVKGPIWKRSSWRKVGEHNWTKRKFEEFRVDNFLEIEEIEMSDDREVRIRYRNRERHHFLAVGGNKRVTRFVGTDGITAKLKSKGDIEHVCIVDAVRELRQCLR